MYFNFKKWVKGDTPEEYKKLTEVDSAFGMLIEKLEDKNLDRESIFIYGMFNLLEYLHHKNNDLLHRLTLLLEAYKIFVRMRTKYNEFPKLASKINVQDLGEEFDINIDSIINYKSDGSAECFSLITAMIDYICSLKSEKDNFDENNIKKITKH